jgi:hypothetical protein
MLNALPRPYDYCFRNPKIDPEKSMRTYQKVFEELKDILFDVILIRLAGNRLDDCPEVSSVVGMVESFSNTEMTPPSSRGEFTSHPWVQIRP